MNVQFNNQLFYIYSPGYNNIKNFLELLLIDRYSIFIFYHYIN